MANRSSKTHKREGKVTSAPVASSPSVAVASSWPVSSGASSSASFIDNHHLAPSSSASLSTNLSLLTTPPPPSSSSSLLIACASGASSVSDRRAEQLANHHKARSPIVTRSRWSPPLFKAERFIPGESGAIPSSSKSKKRHTESGNISSPTDKRVKSIEQATSSKTIGKSRKKSSTHFEVTELSGTTASTSPTGCSKAITGKKLPKRLPEVPLSAPDPSTFRVSSSSTSSSKRFKKSHSSDNLPSTNMERQQHGSGNSDNNNDHKPPAPNTTQPPQSTQQQQQQNASGSSSSNASTPPLPNTPSTANSATNTIISQIVNTYGNNLFEPEEVNRLQSILESRGFSSSISHQILGLPRMQHIFARSFHAGNSSRVQTILAGLSHSGNTSEKLSCVMDLCQMLLMGNEDTLAGFPVKSVVPLLIQILQSDESPELIHHAVRAMTCLMEALPRSSHAVADAIPVFLQKLQTIDYMDVAEQTLSALETLSRRHHKAILSNNGIATCLQFLDFFPLEAQRSALAIVANCCVNMTTEDFDFLKDSLPILNSRLTMDDKKCIESTCVAFSRSVDCYQHDCNIISQIASSELLQNIQTVLVTSPSLLSSESFVSVVRMLSVMCSSCSKISVELLKSNVAETIKILLLSPDSNLNGGDASVHLVSRSSQEIFELSALLAELLPVLPLTGFFEIDLIYLKGSTCTGEQPAIWQWKDERSTWQTFPPQENALIEEAHQAGEDEVDVTFNKTFLVDFNTMQRVNDEANGIVYAVQRKTTPQPGNNELTNRLNSAASTDPRIEWLSKEDGSESFLNFAFCVLNEVYNSSAGVTVRHKCLNGILRILYHTPKEMLMNILQNQGMSSSIATMLSSTDLRTVACAIQMCNILMEKSPQTFSVYFRREGVLHQIRKLYSESGVLDDKFDLKSTPIKKENSDDVLEILESSSSDQVLNRKSSHDRLMDWPREGLPGPSAPGKMRTRKKYYSSKSKKESSSASSIKISSDLLSDASPVGTDSEIATGSTSSSKSGRPKEFLSRFLPNKLNRWNQMASASSSPNLPTTSVQSVTSKEPVVSTKNASREKIRLWIIKHAKLFEETYFSKPTGDGGDFASSDVLNQLTEAIKYFDKDNFKALDMIKQILLESDLSLFEMIHSGLVTCLLNFFTSGDSIPAKEANVRLFLNVFCNIPLTDLIQNHEDIHTNKNAFQILVNKLNGCISQVEQLPIRVQEFSQSSSSRGSQALKYLTSQTIKVSFTKHSSCPTAVSYKGPIIKLEPLTPMHQLERFLIQRGLTTLETDMESMEDDFSDDEVDNQIFLHSGSGFGSRHRLQLMIGDNVVPYDLTLFQAVKQFYPQNDSDSDHALSSKFWGTVYPIFYKAASAAETDALAGNSNSLGRSRSKGAKGSKASKKKDELWLEGKTPKIESPFSKYLEKGLSFTFKDESIDALNLMKIMFSISRHWPCLYQISNSVSPLISHEEFVNQKLTMKANRQLQDVITIIVGQIPAWITEIAYSCPFVFPFDTRYSLFHIASFDKDRALQRYIENNSNELSGLDSRQRTSLPRLEKRKRTVTRQEIFKSAEAHIFNDYLNPKNLLEISYENEVGTGLGPTLEFYSLLSKEFQRNDFEMWRVDQTPPCDSKKTVDSEMNNYVFSHNGLFPAPIGRGMKVASINKLKSRFRFLGKFIAKALMDSRLVDIPLNIVFYKWLLDEENGLNILDMHHVDSSFANSLLQMNRIAQRKQKMDLNHQDDLLKLHGCNIEELQLEFTLPGYPNIELKKNGRDQAVMLSNLESYLNLVSHWMLYEGVSKQLEAFREGFNSIFSLSHLKIFYPEELQKLFCGTPNNKWETSILMKSTKTDHGYTHDSRAIKFLFEILSNYNVDEQRRFLQFITGCPRLPIGGFKALSPPLTIVRKDSDQLEQFSLPSVMTCANYLKLPDYPTLEVMREKLALAISEGQGSFHLS